MVEPTFWRGKHVFVTGHTGFKGSWLALWLTAMGAEVTGYALGPPSQPSLFTEARVAELVTSVEADIRDLSILTDAVMTARPDVVLHLAAQSLVRASYDDPVGTFATNVLGTVNLLEAVRGCPSVRVVVNVTSDKCYENTEQQHRHRESDPMGGHDPYSSSKGCAELAASAYRRSFFAGSGTAIASARAGNVIGGGDWAEDRLVPDLLRAFGSGEVAAVRNPNAVRPWQHVLEPLSGYLALAERLWANGEDVAGGWNFGPRDADAVPVARVVEHVASAWGPGAAVWTTDDGPHPHEAHYLHLDTRKARESLEWRPRWPIAEALARTVDWHRAWLSGADARDLTLAQISDYQRTDAERFRTTHRPDSDESASDLELGLPRADLVRASEMVGAETWCKLDGARILLTGGTGIIGTWLTASLLHAVRSHGLDTSLVILSRDPDAFARARPELAGAPEVTTITGDVRTFELPPIDLTHVVHAAADIVARHAALEEFDVLVTGTHRALDQAAARGATELLLLSSGAVYGTVPAGLDAITETYPGGPSLTAASSAYGEGKRVSEWLVHRAADAGLAPRIARCFALVGPHVPLDAHFAVGNFLADALAGRSIEVLGDGTTIRSYLHTADLAGWLWSMLLRAEPGATYNVGGAEAVSMVDLAARVNAAVGSSAGVTVRGNPEPSAQPMRYVPDVSAIRRDLALPEPIGLDDAIARTAAWHRQRREG